MDNIASGITGVYRVGNDIYYIQNGATKRFPNADPGSLYQQLGIHAEWLPKNGTVASLQQATGKQWDTSTSNANTGNTSSNTGNTGSTNQTDPSQINDWSITWTWGPTNDAWNKVYKPVITINGQPQTYDTLDQAMAIMQRIGSQAGPQIDYLKNVAGPVYQKQAAPLSPTTPTTVNTSNATNSATNSTAQTGPQTLQNVVSIRRDNQDNIYAIDSTGKEVKLTAAQAFSGGLGINADFVPRGSTVSLGIAQVGNNQSNVGDVGVITRTVLDGLAQKGLVINPNVDITPEKAAEFLAMAQKNIDAFLPQAQKELAPYYASQLALAKDALYQNLGYTADEVQRKEQDITRQYGQNVRTVGETAADVGFAQSGLRTRNEANLAYDTQNSIDSARRKLAYDSSSAVKTFAQDWGSSNLGGAPTIKAAPRVIAGGGVAQDNTDNALYQLSDNVYQGLIGTKQYEQRAAEQGRAAELEGAYRSYNATPQPRTIA